MLVKKEEDKGRRTLTRRISSFRKGGEHYRRDDEVHHLQLYESSELAKELRRVGFRVSQRRRDGR